MSAREARIWVLITDGLTARICSTEDGAATPILTPRFPTEAAGLGDGTDRNARLHRVWFKSDGKNLFGGVNRQFAKYLAQILHEGANDHAFDGLIVIATADTFSGLKEALSPATRALLIGEVIRDLPHRGVTDADVGVALHH